MNEEPARVFISCGQRDGDERDFAHRVKEMFERELGFEAYVAVYEQTLRSLRENIFERLANQTEYFLFVDFCREKIDGRTEHRGSVFRTKNSQLPPSLSWIVTFSFFRRMA